MLTTYMYILNVNCTIVINNICSIHGTTTYYIITFNEAHINFPVACYQYIIISFH